MPSHELIRVLTPLPSLVLTTLIDTALPLSALLDQLVQENDQQLKREVSGDEPEEEGWKKWALVRVRRRAVGDWTEGERLEDEIIESVVESCGVRKVLAGGGGRLEFVVLPLIDGQLG
ncbi:hypothetical protein RQP46_005602 [Phenoliferia psychrophenolica]